MPRPRLVLAMHPGLEPYVFRRGRRQRLGDLAHVLDDAALGSFDDPRADALLADAEVLLTHWGAPLVDAAVLDRAPALRLVAHGAGTVKGIVDPVVFERGILVTSAASANAVPVAEFTLAAILFANKDVFGARERDRAEPPDFGWFDRSATVGNVAKRVGIIGASHVGRLVIGLLAPFDLDVVVADPYLSDDDAAALGVQRVELDELVATADVVSVHAPELPETHQLLDAGRLRTMRDGATVINTARGAIVDTDALTAELATGRISAVLDVTDPEPLPADHPLRSLPNVFLTPHIAGSAGTEIIRMTDLVLDELARFAEGAPPLHPVTAADLARIA